MKRDDPGGFTAENRQKLAPAERGGGEGSSSTAAPAPASAETEQTELQKRLAALHHAERIQHEHYRQQQEQIARTFQGDPARPNPTPQQAAAMAQAQKEVQDWVAQRPGIINDPQAIATGTRLVHLGFVLGSPAWRNAMEQQGFGPRDYAKQQHQHQPPLARASETASENEQQMEATERDESARYISAPVSRGDAPTLSGQRNYNLSASSVRLSPDELAIAKASGQTPVEYARAKLKLAELKKTGLINDGQ